ncbi:cutinase family protein [Candidatus Saccharibacteria bacterium]|nr:cutinase family protein [Candidatus Saccharibacteria bacterium]
MRLKRFRFPKLNLTPLAISLTLIISNTPPLVSSAVAIDVENDPNFTCADVEVIFARGSGSKIHATNYQVYEQAFRDTFADSGLSLGFYELGSNKENGGYGGYSYPSPGIGVYTWQRFKTSLGAIVSGGEYYSYGDSIEEGSNEAATFIMAYKNKCKNSKIVLGGYSQGANTVSRTLQKINPSWIYAALTFGDPKLYLPEGKPENLHTTTRACREGSSSFSHYRAFVPDCHTYEGILGGFKPYDPELETGAYEGKLKAYCQMHDVICASYIDPFDLAYGHATYKEQGTYKRAAEDVYNDIFPGNDKYEHPTQNVVLLFDSTDSMSNIRAAYEDKAISVAEKYLKNGGKVALFTYADLADKNAAETTPAKLCDFETCSLDNIRTLIKGIKLEGGGDFPESLLSSAHKAMSSLTWTTGANKSVIVFTDETFHSPDRDGTTLADVIELSKNIDPVNFYVITRDDILPSYAELISETGGKSFSHREFADPLEEIDKEISSRTTGQTFVYQEKSLDATISDLSSSLEEGTATINYTTDAAFSILTINEEIMGYTELTSFEISDLDLSRDNLVCLTPVSKENFKGKRSCVNVKAGDFSRGEVSSEEVIVPLAPNTGRPRR